MVHLISMIQKRKIKIKPAGQIVLGFLAVILIGTFLLCLPISSQDGKWFSFVDSSQAQVLFALLDLLQLTPLFILQFLVKL